MGEKRKLQADIEKTLRRVEEGIVEFDDVLEKTQDAVTASQKEKLEAELKRDIKKLQRYRDQIRTWLSASEVKDKGPLEESRRAIEKEMEKFKACEKLFKLKAFSKEGLAQQTKVYPQEAERERHRKWIREALERFSTDTDFKEAELEKAKATPKKGKAKASEDSQKIAGLQKEVGRYKWHVSRLEQVLRALENDSIELTVLDRLKEYLLAVFENERSTDAAEETMLYEEVLGVMDAHESQPSFVFTEEKSSEDADETKDVETKTPVEGRVIANNDSLTESPSVSGEDAAQLSSKQANDSGVDNSTPVVDHDRIASSPQLPPGGHATEPSADIITVSRLDEIVSCSDLTNASPTQFDAETAGPTLRARTTNESSPLTAPSYEFPDVSRPRELKEAAQQAPAEDTRPSSSKESVAPVKGRADLDLLSSIISAAYQNLPTTAQRHRVRYYQPRTLWPTPPPSFPSQPLKHHATSDFFEKLDLDTLFFTFYYQQGTYQQFLAARRLKQNSWIFHKKYRTWFLPQPGPKIVSDQFHRGTYVYFDSEAGWCTRVKHDFLFELADTEMDLQPTSSHPLSENGSKLTKVTPPPSYSNRFNEFDGSNP